METLDPGLATQHTRSNLTATSSPLKASHFNLLRSGNTITSGKILHPDVGGSSIVRHNLHREKDNEYLFYLPEVFRRFKRDLRR